MKKLALFLAIALSPGLSNAARASDLPPTLSLETLSPGVANRIVVAALEDCTRRGYKVSAAVVGRDGNLLAFLRHPLSGPHTAEVSQRKAYSSATFRAPTSALAKARPDLNYAPGALLIVGGIPLSVGGRFYGGVAVAGAEPETDEQCAAAGFASVKEDIEFGG